MHSPRGCALACTGRPADGLHQGARGERGAGQGTQLPAAAAGTGTELLDAGVKVQALLAPVPHR